MTPGSEGQPIRTPAEVLSSLNSEAAKARARLNQLAGSPPDKNDAAAVRTYLRGLQEVTQQIHRLQAQEQELGSGLERSQFNISPDNPDLLISVVNNLGKEYGFAFTPVGTSVVLVTEAQVPPAPDQANTSPTADGAITPDKDASARQEQAETPVGVWDRDVARAAQQVSELLRDVASYTTSSPKDVITYEDLKNKLAQIDLILADLTGRLENVGFQVEDMRYRERRRKLIALRNQLRSIRDSLRTTRPERRTNGSGNGNNSRGGESFSAWKADRQNHPEFFRTDLHETLEKVRKFISETEALIFEPGTTNVQASVDVNSPDLADLMSTLGGLRAELAFYGQRAEEKIGIVKDANGDTERSDKADLLQRTYLEGPNNLNDLLRRMDALRLKVWELRLPAEWPKLIESLEELPGFGHLDPVLVPGNPPTVYFNEWTSDIAEIETVISGLDAEIDAHIGIDDLRVAKKVFIEKNYLDPLRKEQERRQAERLKFWKNNAEALQPELRAVITRLNAIAANPDAYATDAARQELEQLERDLGKALEVRGPDYFTAQQALFDRLAQVEADLRMRIEEKTAALSREEKIQALEHEIESTEELKLTITPQRDEIQRAYQPLREKAQRLQNKELEAKVLKTWFKHMKHWADEEVTFLENADKGAGDTSHLIELFNNHYFPKMENIIKWLRDIGDSEEHRYEHIYKEAYTATRDRLMLNYSWALTYQRILAPKEGAAAERRPPPSLNQADWGIDGERAQRMIRNGFQIEGFGELTNVDFGPNTPWAQKLTVRSLTTPDTYEKPGNDLLNPTGELHETAFGAAMRMFDEVYEGRRIFKASSGEDISTRNLHNTYPELIKQVTAELQKVDNKVTAEIVTRAFRLHTIITLNHTYLAESSPTLADYLYYSFNWLDYCLKYEDDGTNTFAPLFTYMLFGYKDFNILEALFGKEKVEAIEKAFRQKGLLDPNSEIGKKAKKDMGFSNFKFMLNGSLIKLRNVAQGKDREGKIRVKTPNLLPPLRAFAVKTPVTDATGKVVDYRPLRYPTTAAERADKKVGRVVILDDIQDQDGERAYELMPLDIIGTQFPEYYNQLSKNGVDGILSQVLKQDRQKLLSSLNSPVTVSGIKNQMKYSADQLPVVGELIKFEDGEVKDKEGNVKKTRDIIAEAVKHQVTIMIVFAKLLIETHIQEQVQEVGKTREVWNQEQVKQYLIQLHRQQIIPDYAAEAIEIAVLEGSRTRIAIDSALARFEEQLRKATLFR